MKEFSAQTGGRYVYVDDVLNLQELSLAFGEIFDECDNFIVSGCTVSGSSISSGLVYLNGKLRYFSGATGITTWPQYIYELNQSEQVTYASGGAKVGRNNYGCTNGSTVPTTLDDLTGKVPVALKISSSGGTMMKDAFLGRYALLLNAATGTQTVNGTVNFANDVSVAGTLTLDKPIKMKSGSGQSTMSTASDSFGMEYVGASGAVYRFDALDGTGFRFSVNGTVKLTVGDSGITCYTPITADKATIGSSVLNNAHFYNGTAASNAGELNINMLGYNGGTSYYRNTYIGNGKGKAMVSVLGSDGTIELAGTTTISSSGNEGIVLLANLPKSNLSLQKTIFWKDSNKDVIGYVGFSETTDQTFRITNNVAAVIITGQDYVDLGPVIKENGVLLSDKYVTKTALTEALGDKAGSDAVYSKTAADDKFAAKTGGLVQFVTGSNTAAVLRSQIDAVGSSDLAKYAALGNYLSDMATDETAKKKIRDNIGALASGDYQVKLKDSGWVSLGNGLYVRQIGNIVSVQGTVKTIHSGTLFSIPNTIDAPTHEVYQSISFNNNRNWTVSIKAGVRQCNVLYCSGSCGQTTDFSIMYMV